VQGIIRLLRKAEDVKKDPSGIREAYTSIMKGTNEKSAYVNKAGSL
jgi:hypothetical protein